MKRIFENDFFLLLVFLTILFLIIAFKTEACSFKDSAGIYRANVLRVIDGDTIEVMSEYGDSNYQNLTLRFFGVNAPETRTKYLAEKKRGLCVKEKLKELIEKTGKVVYYRDHGRGKYGRTLATIFVYEGIKEISLNTSVLDFMKVCK